MYQYFIGFLQQYKGKCSVKSHLQGPVYIIRVYCTLLNIHIDYHQYMRTKCISCILCLSDDTKIAIYQSISEYSKSVTQIVSETSVKQPTVSYHLNKMLKSGLVTFVREGKKKLYKANFLCPHYKIACVLH